MLNARRMNSTSLLRLTTPHRTCVWGSKTPKTITWGYTAPEKRAGTGMQTRRQRDHQSNTLIRRPRSTQHSKRTIFRVHSHAFQQERINSAQDHGLAPQSWRAIASEAQVAAHCRNTRMTNERKQPRSVRHWPADPPPRAKHASSMYMPPVCLHQSPSSGAPASSSSW
jgi:hypothetical protein